MDAPISTYAAPHGAQQNDFQAQDTP